MAILSNQGTLLFTPEGGAQRTVVSNITSTDLTVSYGLSVSHGATPTTFGTGDVILYTVVLRNTGSGTLVLPGDPALRCGDDLQLALGQYGLGGTYRIRWVQHRLEAGTFFTTLGVMGV